MKKKESARLKKLERKIGLEAQELKDWARMARKMRAPRPGAGKVIEQHDGYFDLPHYDPKDIPPDEVPLYFHWAYYRMFQWDMIKQPDVLLLLFFFSHEWSDKDKQVNYEFYEPRCAHDSSLSPCVHAILASELGKHAEAYRLARYAMRLDLDDYHRNTNLGLHTTSMAGAWLTLVYGYGGMRSDGAVLSFRPALPARWNAFGFRIVWRDAVLSARIDRQNVTLKAISGGPVPVDIFGKRHRVTEEGLSVAMPKDRLA
jgi:maltose phosphorylase